MWTKYFMQGIDIRKYSNVFQEARVFSHVGWLSIAGFDEISEAQFEAGTSLIEMAEQESKRLQNVPAPILHVLRCVLQTGKVKLFLEVKMKRERVCVCVCVLCVCVCVCVCVCAVSVNLNEENEREYCL